MKGEREDHPENDVHDISDLCKCNLQEFSHWALNSLNIMVDGDDEI